MADAPNSYGLTDTVTFLLALPSGTAEASLPNAQGVSAALKHSRTFLLAFGNALRTPFLSSQNPKIMCDRPSPQVFKKLLTAVTNTNWRALALGQHFGQSFPHSG
ncbi:MAG TPA: hypothetical protein V6D11_17425 [Waterburya sp.]